MLALLFQCIGKGKEFFFTYFVTDDICNNWFTGSYGTCFIKYHCLCPSHFLQSCSTFIKNTVFGSLSASNHYGHRSCQSQGTRTRYYKYAYSSFKTISQILGSNVPDNSCNKSNSHYCRNKYPRDFICNLCYRCL